MTSVELTTAFMSLVAQSVGAEWDLKEAQDAKFLMETLLHKTHSSALRAALMESLSVLNREIARLMN